MRDLSKQRYDGGVTSYLEVIENDRAAFEAELQYSQARRSICDFTYSALFAKPIPTFA